MNPWIGLSNSNETFTGESSSQFNPKSRNTNKMTKA